MSALSETEYLSIVGKIVNGKRLPDAIYLHKSAFENESFKIRNFVHAKISSIKEEKITWNIIKLFRREFKISLLHYPGFFSSAYPALRSSVVLNLINGTYSKRNYEHSPNPPILHRKETFILPDHPSAPFFRELTREGELAGLYQDVKLIGFKKTWQKLIAQKGYELVNGRLIPLMKNEKKNRPTPNSD